MFDFFNSIYLFSDVKFDFDSVSFVFDSSKFFLFYENDLYHIVQFISSDYSACPFYSSSDLVDIFSWLGVDFYEYC